MNGTTQLDELQFSHSLFMDRTTVLYGESETGKSVIIRDILYHLKPFVDQAIVIAPSDRKNGAYSKQIIPKPCVHYVITEKLLNDIWERQEALGATYTRANQPHVLRGLFNRLCLSQVQAAIDSIDRQRHESEKELRSSVNGDQLQAEMIEKKIEDMRSDSDKLITLIYRRYIHANRAALGRMHGLSEDERFALKYLDLNPRLVLIFDDCTAQIKKFKSHPVMQEIFYQGRWAYITAIIACHTDKGLDTELRKNTFVTIFTVDSAARGYLRKQTADVSKEDLVRADSAIKIAFTPLRPYQKLAYVRREKKWYRFTAVKRTGFKFCADIIRNYCDAIQADGMSFSTSNRFIGMFT